MVARPSIFLGFQYSERKRDSNAYLPALGRVVGDWASVGSKPYLIGPSFAVGPVIAKVA